MTKAELIAQIKKKKSYLCVGLDPVLERIPAHLHQLEDPIFEFCKQIIDATAEYCVAYKPNLAFFEQYGVKGIQAFEKVVNYISKEHFIIADAKRGDIGNTSKAYANAFYNHYDCDGLTIAPYMGEDSIRPFLGYEGKFAIVLGLTSNKGSQDFQQLKTTDNELLHEVVIKKCAEWGSPEELMFVVGATHPEELQTIRNLVPNHFFLIPGIGAQGGDLKAVSKAALNNDYGILINSSRAIIYADNTPNFAQVSAKVAKDYVDEMAVFF